MQAVHIDIIYVDFLQDSSASPDRMGIKVTVDRKMGSVGKALYKFFTEINSNESRTVVKPTAVLSTIRQW